MSLKYLPGVNSGAKSIGVIGYAPSEQWQHEQTVELIFLSDSLNISQHLDPAKARALADQLVQAADHAEGLIGATA